MINLLDHNISSRQLKNSFQNPIKNPTIILDSGTSKTTIGLSNNSSSDHPITFPSVFGIVKPAAARFSNMKNQVGEMALQKRGLLMMHYPMQANGLSYDWVGMNAIFDHAFDLLELNESSSGSSYPLLLTENNAFGNDDVVEERKRKAEKLFENGSVSKIAIVNQAILTLVSYGLYTGTVFHSGHFQSLGVCIEDCKLIPELKIIYDRNPLHNRVLENGGFTITEYVIRMLEQNFCLVHGYNSDKTVPNQIKETLCKIKPDPSQPLKDEIYELPDGAGQLVLKGEWLESCTEPFFGRGSYCFENLIDYAIREVEQEEKKPNLYKNIVLGGGNSQFPGFRERLLYELEKITPYEYKSCVNIHPFLTSQKSKNLEFKGAQILSELTSFQHDAMVTKKDFEEFGPSIFHSRNFNIFK